LPHSAEQHRQLEENLTALDQGPLLAEETAFMQEFGDVVHKNHKRLWNRGVMHSRPNELSGRSCWILRPFRSAFANWAHRSQRTIREVSAFDRHTQGSQHLSFGSRACHRHQPLLRFHCRWKLRQLGQKQRRSTHSERSGRESGRRDVILVEDILDTGLTINYLLKNLEARGRIL